MNAQVQVVVSTSIHRHQTAVRLRVGIPVGETNAWRLQQMGIQNLVQPFVTCYLVSRVCACLKIHAKPKQLYDIICESAGKGTGLISKDEHKLNHMNFRHKGQKSSRSFAIGRPRKF